ncbi:MAG TPA: MFS transporter, partial [Taishania sp.]|nr:MFS transporter [Taishania sp.]
MFKAYKKDFWLLAFGMFLFMTSFNLLIPELNTMMENLNAGDKKGLVFVFFSIAAAMARPIAGKLSDTIGRKKVMYGGVVIGALICLASPPIGLFFIFLLFRFPHGF